jgi:phosphogluconate dehydratase
VIRLDAAAGRLEVLVPEAEWLAREPATLPDELRTANGLGMGRELFAGMRRSALTAEQGACSWL